MLAGTSVLMAMLLGCHRVEVKTGLDEYEAELVEEVIEGLVRGEGGNVEVVSESLK